jgi:hypothetical protein
MINNLIKGWKTTLLGVGIIIATVVSIIKAPDSISWYPDGLVGIGLGVSLWLAPDNILSMVSKFLGGNQNTTPPPPPEENNQDV